MSASTEPMEACLPDPRDRRDVSDEDIRQIERSLVNVSAAEILWGGPRGDGLVHTVARLSQSVETLSTTVTVMQQRVGGEDGLGVQLTQLKNDFDRKHAENTGRIRTMMAIGAPMIPGMIWLVYRSITIAMNGHL